MTTFDYASGFSILGTGIDGATVNAYNVARFAGQPALNDPAPSGDPDATTMTGATAGFDGAFTIALPTTDQFYISVVYLGVTYWSGPVQGAGAGGSGGPGGLPLVEVDTTTTQCGDALGWGTFSIGSSPISFTFTVPDSGQVRVEVSVAGTVSASDDSGPGGLWMTVKDGASFGGTQVAPIQLLAYTLPSSADASPATGVVGGRWTYDSGVITGLTPGDSLTWHLSGGQLANTFEGAWLCTDGSDDTVPWGPTTTRVFPA